MHKLDPDLEGGWKRSTEEILWLEIRKIPGDMVTAVTVFSVFFFDGSKEGSKTHLNTDDGDGDGNGNGENAGIVKESIILDTSVIHHHHHHQYHHHRDDQFHHHHVVGSASTW